MPETGARSLRRAWPAVWILGSLVALAILAPVIANDKPILARVSGGVVAPALADLPMGSALFGGEAIRSISWEAPGAGLHVLLRAPVPFSFRGIRLDESLEPPGLRHLLGTDALGRDLLARLIHGTRSSVAVGFGAAGLALLVGIFLGGLAGLRGGLVDLLVTRLTDVVSCFPPFVLALAFVAASGRGGLGSMVAAIALSRWTGMARYVRGEVLRLAGSELWIAARATGGSVTRLALRHLLPLLAPALAVMAAFGVAHAILLESGMSFVGLGVEPPMPSWGSILADARSTLDAAWWPVAGPSVALVLVLGALCLAGETASRGEGSTGLGLE